MRKSSCDNCPNINNPSQADSDSDRVGNDCDNCPDLSNAGQEDTCPPQGNGIGDICDCEGNFDCDADTDGTDAGTFKTDFGRSLFNNPCISGNQCHGDFDCDQDCDGTDAAKFKEDFGRSQYYIPCTICSVGNWCSYSEPTTTSTVPITTTSTVPITTTTSTMQPQCDLTISPASAVVYTWETLQFSTILSGDCKAPCYTWEVQSSIGSTIDSNGLYAAGNIAGTDTVTVNDNCNMDISDYAIVDVLYPTTSTTTTIP